MTPTKVTFLTTLLVSAFTLSAPAWAIDQTPKPTLGSQFGSCGALSIFQYGEGFALQVPVDSSDLDRAAEIQFGRAANSLRIKKITYQTETCEGEPSTFVLSCRSNGARLIQFETLAGEILSVSLTGKASLEFSVFPRTIQTPWETLQDHYFQITAVGDNIRRSGLRQALNLVQERIQLYSRVVCEQV